MRIKIVRLVAVGLFFVLIVHLINLQIVQNRFYFDLSRNNRIRVVPLEGQRGRILDRNGTVLAHNQLSFDLSVIPQEIKNEAELFAFLGEVLRMDPDRLESRFEARRFAPFAPVVLEENIARSLAIQIEENKFRFPGLLVEENFRRSYPYGGLYAHAIGYVGKINRLEMEKMKDYGYTPQSLVGKSGVEEYYDSFLQAEDGGLQVEVNSRGQQVRMLGYKRPSVGKDLILSLDHRIQHAAGELMAGRKGAIVVMEEDSGEILSLVSAPDFDPNIFSRKMTEEESAYVFNNPEYPLLNRAISGQYPPGSVYKIVVGLAALEAGKISENTSFTCPGYLMLGKQQFRCAHTHGLQNLPQAIAHSCNVYFFHVGSILGPDLMAKYARLLGLGAPTHVDLPYEMSGAIPTPLQRKLSQGRGWFKGDTLNVSIGQGDVLTTPLQLVNMMAIVANEGKEVYPHLIKWIGGQEINKYNLKNYVSLKELNLQKILRGVKSVVSEDSGTASLLNLPGVSISGKTGTAQSYGGKDHHAWFVGFAQSEKSRMVFCVFLEFGGASSNAVQIAKDLLARLQEEEVL